MEAENQFVHSEDSMEKRRRKQKYDSLIETKEFKRLIHRKKTFILPTTLFFLAFYFTLPLLAAYTKILHIEVIPSIPWVWVFALAQFVLVWACGWIYIRKSKAYDSTAESIVKKYKEKYDL